MSEIDAPSHIPLQAGEGAKRVTRASTTSDDSSAQQQSSDQKAHTPEKSSEVKEKPATHDTTVTLSTNLSSLESGSKISANYLGVDGQDRPLISSETGTYVVKYDAALQEEIDKLPPHAQLDVKILKVEREIEARIVYQDPSSTTKPISIPVTLELTGLGTAPPKVRTPIDPHNAPSVVQQNAYQATGLNRAERIAVDSAHKLKELPLPATTTNYTLFEKAVPQQSRPAVSQTSISGNALIVQEQPQKPLSQPPILNAAQTPPASPQNINKVQVTGPEKTSPTLQVSDVEKLLHKNTLASVVKNINSPLSPLPPIVQKHFEQGSLLQNLKAGSEFTLRIHSIAIPEIRPSDPPAALENIRPLASSGVSGNNTTLAPKESLSGIVIAPGQHLLSGSEKSTPILSRQNSRYPDSYSPTSLSRPNLDSSFKTVYVATPVSVIKFQSPIELKPGTIINFGTSSFPENTSDKATVNQSSGPKPASNLYQNETSVNTTQSSGIQKNETTGWVPTSLNTTAVPNNQALLPQPLETLTQNWQSLSQILSTMPLTESNPIAQSMHSRIPTPQNPGQMTSTMIFFFAAMGAKNPAKAWLGSGITQQIEKSGHSKLLTMLDQDMRRIFRMGAETPSNEWRPVMIPVNVSGEVNAVPLLIRHITDENNNKDKTNGQNDEEDTITSTRFIVELSLTQFGQIQVDGLMKEKKLNIIIRSKNSLDSDLKNKVSLLFTNALEASGYSGELTYRENVTPDISVQNMINQNIHTIRS